MRVLMITSEWPTPEHPEWVPFIVQQVKFLRQANVEVEVFAFRGRKNLLNYLRAWFQLRRQYDITDFDLIHAQFGQSGLLALPASVPMVVTFRGSDLQGFVGVKGSYTVSGVLLRMISQYSARRARKVIIVSQNLAKQLPPQTPATVIPSGIDLDLFRPVPQLEARKALGLPLNKGLVLFAANPQEPIKRYPLARATVERLKNELQVDLVTMFGVPHSSVPLYMNACDVLLLTSTHEGSPNVVKEALACNLPIVSVDVGDVRQRIESVTGCIVCQDSSPETIAAGLARVLRDRPHIRGREAIADLDEKVLTQKVIEVYQDALTGG